MGRRPRARTRVYFDANVLVAASRGAADALRSVSVATEARAVFVASDLLLLETLPHAVRERQADQVAWLRAYLDASEVRAVSRRLFHLAVGECERLALQAADAIHLAVAHDADADLFVTAERKRSPMYRTGLVRVVHARELAGAL